MIDSMADKVAALFDNDGQRFELDDGRTIEDVMIKHYGATLYRSGWFVTDPVAYRLADGSAIVVNGDGWDVEGDEPFSWAEG